MFLKRDGSFTFGFGFVNTMLFGDPNFTSDDMGVLAIGLKFQSNIEIDNQFISPYFLFKYGIVEYMGFFSDIPDTNLINVTNIFFNFGVAYKIKG